MPIPVYVINTLEAEGWRTEDIRAAANSATRTLTGTRTTLADAKTMLTPDQVRTQLRLMLALGQIEPNR